MGETPTRPAQDQGVLSGFNCLRPLIRRPLIRPSPYSSLIRAITAATLAMVVLFVLDRLVLWMEARG
jgi:hypothetical protein